MIETRTFKLEQTSYNQRYNGQNGILNFDLLAKETAEFSHKVSLVQLNFEGPDHFGLEGNFSDLQVLLHNLVEELNLHQSESSFSKIRIGMNFFENEHQTMMDIPITDGERISMIVFGLKNLIQSCQKSALEPASGESFFEESPLKNILKELENTLWIFSLFSKY